MVKNLKVVGISLLALSMSMMAACSKTDDKKVSVSSTATATATAMAATPKADTKEKVKLKVMTISTDEARNKIMENYIKPNIEAALPDVTVEFEPGGGGDDMANKLKTYNASGDLPDVWWGGTDSFSPIHNAGNVMDLTPYITKDGFIGQYSVPEALKNADGKIYSLSSGADSFFTPVIFYHKDMFEQAGVQVPQSYDQLIEVSKKLKAKGFVPITTPGKGGWAPSLYMFQQMVQIGDPQAMQDLVSNKTNFDNPSIKEGLGRIEQLAKAGVFPEGVSNLDYGPAKEMFMSKKAAMYWMFTWELPSFVDDANVDFFVAPPASNKYDSSKVAQFWGSPLNGYMVNAKSKNPDQAVKLLEFLAMADAQYFESTGAPVALKTGKAKPEPKPLMKKFLDWYTPIPTKIASYHLNAQDAKTTAEFGTLGANLLTGQYSADEFINAFRDTWSKNTFFKQ